MCNRISLAVILSAMAPALFACASSNRAKSEEEGVVHRVAAADLEALKSTAPLESGRALLYVNGLGCPLCATNVDVQLERVRGVSEAKVDLGAGTVLIEMPDKTKPSPRRLADAVKDAGFTLVRIEPK